MMNAFFKSYKFQLLFIGMMNLLVVNFLLQLYNQPYISSDSYNYLEAAQNLYFYSKVHYYRPIVMAAITGVPYLFSNSDQLIFDFSLLLNVICWFGTVLLLFKICKNYLTQKKAFYIGIIYLFLIGNLVIVFDLLTETIFVFVVLLAYYLLTIYFSNKTFLHLSLALSLIILGVLIKPGTKFFAIIVFFFFAKEMIKNYNKRSFVFIYASLLLLFLQCFKMYNQYGNFKISYIDSVTYYNYLGTKSEYLKKNEELKDFGENYRNNFIYNLTYKEADVEAKKDLKEQITTNSFNLIRAYIYDLHHNTTGASSMIKLSENIKNKSYFINFKLFFYWVSKFQNVVFTFLGFFLAISFFIKNNKESFIILTSLFVIYTILLSGITMAQGDRFHLVTFPFALILLAKFWSKKSVEN